MFSPAGTAMVLRQVTIEDVYLATDVFPRNEDVAAGAEPAMRGGLPSPD